MLGKKGVILFLSLCLNMISLCISLPRSYCYFRRHLIFVNVWQFCIPPLWLCRTIIFILYFLTRTLDIIHISCFSLFAVLLTCGHNLISWDHNFRSCRHNVISWSLNLRNCDLSWISVASIIKIEYKNINIPFQTHTNTAVAPSNPCKGQVNKLPSVSP